MKTLVFLVLVFCVWIIYEYWRAPLLKENEDGSWTTIRPVKKIKDLWRKQS